MNIDKKANDFIQESQNNSEETYEWLDVAKHFGYKQEELASVLCHQYSPDKAFEKMERLREIICAKNKKTRIVIDYDPDYPKVLLQFF